MEPKEKQGKCMKGMSGAVNGCFVFYSFIIYHNLTVLSLDTLLDFWSCAENI